MAGKQNSILSQMANLQINGSITIKFHPRLPLMYFGRAIASENPELDFNSTKYYYNDQDLTEFNQVPLKKLHRELCSSPEFESSYGTPFRVMTTVDDQHVILPAYMPLIDDVEGYAHKGVAVFMRWYCVSNSPQSPYYIPIELVSFFDLKVLVDLDHVPIFAVPTCFSEIVFGANKLGVHVMEVKSSLSVVYLTVQSDITRFSGSRYFTVGVSSEEFSIHSKNIHFVKGSVFVIWNLRSVHRPSFRENFQKIHERYRPTALLMTEARLSRPMTYYIRNQLGGLYGLEYVGPNTGLGGVLLAWDKTVQPYFTRKQDTLYGHIVSISITPRYSMESGIALPISDDRGFLEGTDSEEDGYEYFL